MLRGRTAGQDRRADEGLELRRARVEYSLVDGRLEGTVSLPGQAPQRFSSGSELEACLKRTSHRLLLVEEPTAVHPSRDGVAELSPTERQIAQLAATGSSNRQIADALFYSVKSIEAYLTRIYRRLGIEGRDELGSLVRDLDVLDEQARQVVGGAGRRADWPQGRAGTVVTELLLVCPAWPGK